MTAAPSFFAMHPAQLRKHRMRRAVNLAALSLSMLAMAFGLCWLLWILFEIIRLGVAGLNMATFIQMTPPPMVEDGGLLNAIVGSLLMVGLATLCGTPMGILSGVYLSEYGRKTWLASLTRFMNDILLSAPSIVIGLFVNAVLVAQMKTYSAWAGVFALALIVVPVVTRTTENMLTLTPNALREAAYALGTPKWRVIMSITLKSARAGVITGVLLALARIAGETAPLLHTALSNPYFSWNLSAPMASLPVTIFKFAMDIDPNLKRLAWAGVFIIAMGVLALNILARVLFRSQR
jgi:phosphate transport system permease protein